MTKKMAVAGVVMTVALAGTGSMAEAQSLSLTVRLRNDAGVTDAVLKDAKDGVTRVYANAGVTLTWVDARPNITVILLPREMADKLHQSADTMGFAPGSGTYRSHISPPSLGP